MQRFGERSSLTDSVGRFVDTTAEKQHTKKKKKRGLGIVKMKVVWYDKDTIRI